jgi:branched-chain amino acid transport system permease protein
VLATDILVLALFASSLQFVMGTGGMASFGHAAYFGLGAYAAALSVKHGMPMEAPGDRATRRAAGAFVVGGFCAARRVSTSRCCTLAFAQIVWSVAFSGTT